MADAKGIKGFSKGPQHPFYKHGCASKTTATVEYKTWNGMKKRCYNVKCERYPRYGGRGIRVCSRWRDSFEVFLADMGPKPSAAHQLDRINNDLDYEPSNCRWATRIQQARNRSRVKVLTYCGQTHSLQRWAEIIGVSYKTLWVRTRRRMPVARILFSGDARSIRFNRTFSGQQFAS